MLSQPCLFRRDGFMSRSPAADECPTAALISSNTPRYRLSDTKLSHVSGWCSNLSKRSFAVVSLH